MSTSASPRTILILQGGGALGAYECGVYRALVPRLSNLAVVAGTSIGAINAGVIARHYETKDRGAGALQRFWTDALRTPSWPFFPPVGEWRRWNAVWTSLLAGHPHLFTPPPNTSIPWVFRPPVSWYETHFYDTSAMERTLSDPAVFGSYGPSTTDLRLLVTAVDIESGVPQVFDSRAMCLTATHLIASGSIPPSFPPREIDGKFYWDGGLWSNTPLGPVLNVLQDTDTVDEIYEVYIVDVLPPHRPIPQTMGAVVHRMNEIIYADKTEYDAKASGWVNAYIDLLKTLKAHEDSLPKDMRRELQLDDRYRQTIQEQKRVHLNIRTIRRTSPQDEQGDQISGGTDFSEGRIQELLAQGYEDTRNQLNDFHD